MTAVATHRRPGLTLTEVLVAMFVMALGLISLLTLFPLGAIQIGYALRDDRCAQTAADADAFLRAWWQAKVVEAPNSLPTEEAFWAMDDPNLRSHVLASGGSPPDPTLFTNTYLNTRLQTTFATANNTKMSSSAMDPGDTFVTPNPSGYSGVTSPSYYVRQGAYSNLPSYPVFVDPLNVLTNGTGGAASWVGYTAGGSLRVPRRGLSTATTTQAILQTSSLLDDITYDTNGTPLGSPFTRDGRYNWSAVIQRQTNDRRNVANLTILVFDGRPPLLKVPDAEVVVSLADNTARNNAGWTVTPPSTSVKLTLPPPTDPDAPSVVRRGGWLMDGSFYKTPSDTRNAQFYRIVGLTETGTANEYQLDIEPPVRNVPGSSSTEPTTLYFFAGLAEVFVRPPLVPNPIPGQ